MPPLCIGIAIGIAAIALGVICVCFINREKQMVAKFRVEKEKADKANKTKSVFLANMSHEIRTPINAVVGMNEMILRECKDEEIREYAFDIQSAAQTLQSIINDLLDFSKIETGALEIVPGEYDLSRLIYDVQNLVAGRIKEKNLEMKIDVDENLPSRLYGDEARIRQVLMNLLSNAIRYTDEGYVRLRISGSVIADKVSLRCEVEDTGIGIKEEDISKLEVAFERIEENKNKSIGGVGVGITISRNLLKMMGSTLAVESAYGEGSRFYFDLEQKVIDKEPVGNLEKQYEHQAYTYKKRFRAPNAHILVVDDNAVNRKVVRGLLKETQIQITDAASGAECLELVKNNYYDIIFMDYMMPRMDGIETLKAMREMPDCMCSATPVIVLTANAISGARERYLQAGFDSFLSKPIVAEKLEKLIVRFLPEELQLCEESAEISDCSEADADLEQSEEIQLPEIDGINWDYGYLHLPDTELLLETAREIHKTIEMDADYLEQLYENIDEEDNLNLYRIKVHAMKSSMATIGAMSLSGLARLLENAARENDRTVLDGLTGVFLKEWRSYKEKMDVLKEEEGPKEEFEDSSQVIDLLEKLCTASANMDMDRMDNNMKKLRGYKYPDEIEELVQQLDMAVMNFKFSQIPELSDKIRNQI